MTRIIFSFLAAMLFSNLSLASVTKIECKGFVSFENGTMQGSATQTLVLQKDGTWLFNEFLDAGVNLSDDPSILLLDTYGALGGFLKESAVYARFNISTNTLDFKYKYDSGLLGGGTQKTAGTFTDCQTSN